MAQNVKKSLIIITKLPLCFIYVDVYIDQTTRQKISTQNSFYPGFHWWTTNTDFSSKCKTVLHKCICHKRNGKKDNKKKEIQSLWKNILTSCVLITLNNFDYYTFWSPFPPFITLSLFFDSKYLCMLFWALLDGHKHTL